MKKIFALIALMAGLSQTANAQYQLANSDFEEWEKVTYSGKTGDEPTFWSSFLDGTGSFKGAAAAVQLYKDEPRPGSKGTSGVRLTSRSVLGVVAQGNFTNGCVNMGSMTATDANGNYNYINEARTDQSMRFTGHPDAARLWVRFKGAISGNVSVMLTTKGYFQDPAGNNITAKQVAHATNSDIPSNDTWTEYTIPFVVDDATQEPYYCLTNISTCSMPGKGNAADVMYVDDLEMLYYSEATAITYDGRNILGNDQQVAFDPAKLTDVTMTGRAATWTYDFDYNAYELTVTVKGENISEDPTNMHQYTVKFKKPNVQVATATQDGVDLLADASGVIYDKAKCQLTFTTDVVSHTETFDVTTCRLTIVMKDAEDNSFTQIIQFRVPAPAILTAKWNGTDIDLEGFVTGDVYDESLLVFTATDDATLSRQFDEQSLLLTVTASAPAGYDIYNKVYKFQFGLGEMLDPSTEELETKTLVKGNTYIIANKGTGLLLSDEDILGTDVVAWTFNSDGSIRSANGKYVSIDVVGNSGTFGNKNVKSVTVKTSATTTSDATNIAIGGNDNDGYDFSHTTEWSYGLWSSSSYTAYLGTTGTFLAYDATVSNDNYRWELYDVDEYNSRNIRIELYNELKRAEQLGLSVVAYRQEMDKNRTNTEALRTLLGQVRQDESDYVESLYTEDQTVQLGSTVLSDKTVWTTTMIENYGGQHWSGENKPYYEQTGQQWNDGNWSVSASKDITLPAGKYVLKCTARSSARAKAYMQVGDQKVDFPANGDYGLGVDVNGNVNYSTSGTYANGNKGRGWEYRYLSFDMPETGDINISFGGSAEDKYQWISVSDIYLLAQPVPELKMVSFGYEGATYTPDANNVISIPDVYYKADVEPVINTLGYGDITCVYDSATWQMTITLSQEKGINYGLKDQVYTIQFHKANPELVSLTYGEIDLLTTTHVDEYYSVSKLAYTANADAENVKIQYDRKTSTLTVTVSGYGVEKTYTITFKDASEVSSEYTEALNITINQESAAPQEATVTLTKNDNGAYTFELPNFIMTLDGEPMPIGTIVVTDIQMQDEDGVNTFSKEQTINIAPGDLAGYDLFDWYGPMLGDIPVKIVVGKIYQGHMYVEIDIDMTASLDQVIHVVLGDEGNVNAIGAVKSQAVDLLHYDLNGRTVSRTQRGMHVVRGKKFVVK